MEYYKNKIFEIEEGIFWQEARRKSKNYVGFCKIEKTQQICTLF